MKRALSVNIETCKNTLWPTIVLIPLRGKGPRVSTSFDLTVLFDFLYQFSLEGQWSLDVFYSRGTYA